MKRILRCLVAPALLISLVVSVLSVISQQVYASTNDDKYGVTGTFGGSKFVLPRGGSIEESHREVVVVNDSDTVQSFTITQDTPNGIEFILPNEPIEVPPHESRSVEIGVKVADYVAPGEYLAWLVVQQVENDGENTKGTKVTRRVKQPALIKVSGDPAIIRVEPKGPDDKIVDVPVRGFFKDKNREEVEVGRGHGLTEWRVAPGTIRVVAEVDGRLLAEKTVRVRSGQRTVVRLDVTGAAFEGVDVTPIYRWWPLPKTEAVRIDYAVRSYVNYKNVRSEVLIKNSNGQVVHKQTMHEWPSLPKGLHHEAYLYQPGGGVQPGQYAIELRLYQGNTMLALAAPILLTVYDFSLLLWVLLLILLLIVLYVVWRKYRKRKRHKKEGQELFQPLREEVAGKGHEGRAEA